MSLYHVEQVRFILTYRTKGTLCPLWRGAGRELPLGPSTHAAAFHTNRAGLQQGSEAVSRCTTHA